MIKHLSWSQSRQLLERKAPEFLLETDVNPSVLNDVSHLREHSSGSEKQKKKRDRSISVIFSWTGIFMISRAKYRGISVDFSLHNSSMGKNGQSRSEGPSGTRVLVSSLASRAGWLSMRGMRWKQLQRLPQSGTWLFF